MQTARIERSPKSLKLAFMKQPFCEQGMSPSAQIIKNTAPDISLGLSQLLKHLKYGEIKKGKSYGIHFFDHELHRVREYINYENKNGVWEAKIDVRHPKTNAWVQKQKSSTLFPITWSEEILTLKLTSAFQNAKKITSYKYCGSTDCGIKVVFILQNKVITCCYPIWK